MSRLVADWAAARGIAQALSELHAAGLPAARVQTYAEAAREPAVLARDMLQTPPGPPSPPVTGRAAKLSRTPLSVRSPAPALGQHNDEILDEPGIRADGRRRLREQRVI